MSINSASHCSSGNESGWTLYLDDDDDDGFGYGNHHQSFISAHPSRSGKVLREEEDDDENLSMVSDASSGPPYCEFEDWSNVNEPSRIALFATSSRQNSKRQSQNRTTVAKQQRHLHLEDTASSHQAPRNQAAAARHGFDFPQGYPGSHLRDRSEVGKHSNNLLQTSAAEKAAARKSGQSISRKL